MNKIRIFVLLFIIFGVLFSKGICRKYDIEEDAVKLYGEDLKSVLKRFRRTPDYLAILNDKMAELKAYYIEDVGNLALYHYNQKLLEKIEEMYKDDPDFATTAVEPLSYLRTPFGAFSPLHLQGLIPNHIHHSIPQSGIVPRNEKENPVEMLEKYSILTSSLTLQERNMFRDMGFEYAGKMIHSIVKAMGNEDFSEKSTRLPMEGNDRPRSTTEHVHEVMSTNEHQSTKAADIVPTDETFKYKYRAPKISRIKIKS